ncbi:TrkH family potassium uptake protein [Rothia sp. AR01]|uniref:TrkH family potassium uptake protein n=1 Tax=Rothia santali TaxID=2949643 RepID=A0A9X2HF71_9MICC|nr:potassium transporter TrkG [Rothia santali]MCP3426995.1 TrkH family potassium uptake protein [Rothia santali]
MRAQDAVAEQVPRRVRAPWFRGVATRLFGTSPARISITLFLLVIIVCSMLLMLPISHRGGTAPSVAEAFFTSTSAVTVTGLTAVSTASQWSLFGQFVILLGIQIGGLGTLTMTSLLAMALGRKLGLRSKLFAQEGLSITPKLGKLGEVKSLLLVVVLTSAGIEGAIALVLAPRFMLLGEDLPTAVWHGVFYAISSFNNAGFTPHSDGLVPYGNDWWILLPLCAGVWIGSLGFPVILALRLVGFRLRSWNLHTRITVLGSAILVVVGTVLWGAAEWGNRDTIGGETLMEKVLHAVFASVMTRSGGFNLVEMTDLNPISVLITNMLMFVGGGSASTAGGVKITTMAVIFLAIIAEARGDQHVIAFNRTIPDGVLRIAISVVMLSATCVVVGTAALMVISDRPFDQILFEVISAYATCGLSMGISAELPPSGLYILSVLMFIGRLGTVTVATGLALRSRSRLYKYPEERPLIG